MGTRTLVHIKDGKKTIATIYRQYDGYPSGMGNDIKEILNNGNVSILNGYGSGHKNPTEFNGMGCLAAYLIGELKENIGNVYIYPANSSDCGEEYTYTLSTTKTGEVKMKVLETYHNKVIFDGLLTEFDGKTVEAIDTEDAS